MAGRYTSTDDQSFPSLDWDVAGAVLGDFAQQIINMCQEINMKFGKRADVLVRRMVHRDIIPPAFSDAIACALADFKASPNDDQHRKRALKIVNVVSQLVDAINSILPIYIGQVEKAGRTAYPYSEKLVPELEELLDQCWDVINYIYLDLGITSSFARTTPEQPVKKSHGHGSSSKMEEITVWTEPSPLPRTTYQPESGYHQPSSSATSSTSVLPYYSPYRQLPQPRKFHGSSIKTAIVTKLRALVTSITNLNSTFGKRKRITHDETIITFNIIPIGATIDITNLANSLDNIPIVFTGPGDHKYQSYKRSLTALALKLTQHKLGPLAEKIDQFERYYTRPQELPTLFDMYLEPLQTRQELLVISAAMDDILDMIQSELNGLFHFFNGNQLQLSIVKNVGHIIKQT